MAQALQPKIGESGISSVSTTDVRQDDVPKLQLTPREREVAHYIGKAYSNTRIAWEMGISRAHVRTMLCRIYMRNPCLQVYGNTRVALLVWVATGRLP